MCKCMLATIRPWPRMQKGDICRTRSVRSLYLQPTNRSGKLQLQWSLTGEPTAQMGSLRSPQEPPQRPPMEPYGARSPLQARCQSPCGLPCRCRLQLRDTTCTCSSRLLDLRPTTTKWGCAESLPFSQASSHTAYPPPKRPGSRTCLGSSSRTVYELLDSFSSCTSYLLTN
ncbi:hypothetical protein M440DRAFT_1202756 [Trichoderma longibrachiatum ATCC 18648]|uniref:Uncharacterized protein n=1 Tax=Trichoderma longibrachiatum ATCC 18648 TaxID=983965 RepID=A0A2T4CBB3_TRILO|nr:hypothetical protein M440DRAFT_1202756 [Trichoderma longibrachiatum ATCC 18648]